MKSSDYIQPQIGDILKWISNINNGDYCIGLVLEHSQEEASFSDDEDKIYINTKILVIKAFPENSCFLEPGKIVEYIINHESYDVVKLA